MTFAIVAAFALALIPLISLLYEVVKRGLPGPRLSNSSPRRRAG